MVSAQTVANRFLELASENKKLLTPMQLLKLVYLAHGWMLGLYDCELISNRVEAWMYGPVIPELYEDIRQYKRNPITATLSAPTENLTPEMREVINRVYETYKEMSGPALSALTHLPGTPWRITYDTLGDWHEIPNSLIKEYYRNKVIQAKEHSS